MARCILEFLEVRSDLAEVDFLGYVHHALLNKYEHNTMRNIFIRNSFFAVNRTTQHDYFWINKCYEIPKTSVAVARCKYKQTPVFIY